MRSALSLAARVWFRIFFLRRSKSFPVKTATSQIHTTKIGLYFPPVGPGSVPPRPAATSYGVSP